MIYGSQGNGATPHLTANMFMTMTGTSMVHVPYRGETLVLQDMLGGHVDLFFGNVSAALALWRDGKVKVLAVLDKQALAQMPGRADHGGGRPARSRLGRLVRGGRRRPRWRPRCATGSPGLHRGAEDAGRAGEVPRAQRRARRRHAGRDGGLHQGRDARWGEVIKKNNIVVD